MDSSREYFCDTNLLLATSLVSLECLFLVFIAFSRLEVLLLCGNNLSSLPDEIAELTSLTTLVLSHNRLKSLPLPVCEMHQLTSMYLHNNLLQTLPPALLQMSQLSAISLRNNPLVSRFVREHIDEVGSCWQLAHFARNYIHTHNPKLPALALYVVSSILTFYN